MVCWASFLILFLCLRFVGVNPTPIYDVAGGVANTAANALNTISLTFNGAIYGIDDLENKIQNAITNAFRSGYYGN